MPQPTPQYAHMVFTASVTGATGLFGHAYVPPSSAHGPTRKIVRQGCFGIGHPMFPPFYGLLSPDPG